MPESINGWDSLDYEAVSLSAGANANVHSARSIAVTPAVDGDSITSFQDPPDTSIAWLMMVSNSDPTQTKSFTIGGVVFPPGKTTCTVHPGQVQELVYIPTIGWGIITPAIVS